MTDNPIIWSITDGHDSGINQFNYETGETKHAELEKLIDEKHAFFTRWSDNPNQTMENVLSILLDRCGWDIPAHLVYKRTHGPENQSIIPDTAFPGAIKYLDQFKKFKTIEQISVQALPHHMAHTLSAYHSSPFENCMVISWDGQGDGRFYSESIIRNGEIIDYFSPSYYIGVSQPMRWVGHFCKRHISPHVLKLETTASLDYAGKVMGLSAYGDTGDENFRELVNLYKKIMQASADYYAWQRGKLLNRDDIQSNPQRAWPHPWLKDWQQDRKEIWTEKEEIQHCAAVQVASNETLHELTQRQKFKEKMKRCDNNLIITGGSALNVVTNAYLREKTNFNIWVPPDPGDGGLSFGVSTWKAKQLGWKGYDPDKRPDRTISNIPFDTKNIGLALSDSRVTSPNEIANLLVEGKIIGLIQGNIENGARALGHRSILCDPSIPDMRDKINAKIKNREWYRPFAPICRKEDAHKWFNARTFDHLEHMSFTVDVKPECIDKFPSITHVDGTARLQTVTRDSNALLYGILNQHKNVLLNTSFNVQGKPILNSWQTAKRILDETDLDHIVFLNGHELRIWG